MKGEAEEEGLQNELVQLASALSDSAHGCKELESVRAFLKKLKKRYKSLEERCRFLSAVLCRPAILWEDVKDRVWGSEEERAENRFPFLQGDLIETTMPIGAGMARSNQDHGLWLVVTPSCQLVRSNYVAVAPAFPILPSFREMSDCQEKILYDSFGLALSFSHLRRFALPLKVGDGGNTGLLCDFDTPYFLEKAYAFLANPVASLSLAGWHLFNAVLKERETRGNLVDEQKLRELS